VKLGDLLSPERVLVPLRAASLPEAVRLLIDAAVAAGAVADPAGLAEVVRRSWPEDTVNLGQAYLPHFRTDAVDRVVVALGVTAAPLSQPERGDRGVRVVLLVLAPRRAAAAYLQTVAAFARVLGQPETMAALLEADSPAGVLATPAFGRVELGDQLRVRDLMTRDVLSVAPDTPLGEAVHLLLQNGVESLPVVGDNGQLVGTISNRELARVLVPKYVQRTSTGEYPAADPERAAAAERLETMPVREVMQRSVLALSPNQTMAEVAQLLINKDIARFPVTDEGRLVGFLTRADIVRKLVGPI
jgi:CBS domain-containing protein